MNRHFLHYEQAALYATRLQREGYFAKICPIPATSDPALEPASVGGYHVQVSKMGLEDSEETVPLSRVGELLLGLSRFVVVATLAAGTGLALLEGASFLLRGGWKASVLFGLAALVAFYALAGWSALLSSLVMRHHHEDETPSLWVSLGLFVLAVTLAVLGVMHW